MDLTTKFLEQIMDNFILEDNTQKSYYYLRSIKEGYLTNFGIIDEDYYPCKFIKVIDKIKGMITIYEPLLEEYYDLNVLELTIYDNSNCLIN